MDYKNYTLEDIVNGSPLMGKVTTMNYEVATVASNDSLVDKVNGVPKNCFLIAVSKHDPNEAILLTVRGLADFENYRDLKKMKEDLAENDGVINDASTRERLQIIGFSCKIVGTFYNSDDGELKFGGDVDRVLALSSYEVRKPMGGALGFIGSYSRNEPEENVTINFGHVRYTETQKNPDNDAIVQLDIRDFIGKKTGIFSQSRMGKSNTVKIIAQKVYEHSKNTKESIGQVIFDPQGEYSNDNVQDGGSLASLAQGTDVVIYRTLLKNSPNEKPLLINLLEEENLELAWGLMLLELSNGMSAGANYISGLSSIDFEKPDTVTGDKTNFNRAMNHYNRKRLGFYALMHLARIRGSINNFRINIGEQNVKNIIKNCDADNLTMNSYNRGEVNVKTVEGAHYLFTWLLNNINGKNKISYNENDEAVDPLDFDEDVEVIESNALSDSWIRDFSSGDLSEFKKQFESYDKGRTGVTSALNRVKELHSDVSQGDFREAVWKDINRGKIIILDLSKGSPEISTVLSELLVNSLVDHSADLFTSGKEPAKYQLIVEEAHNLFSRKGAKDSTIDPWVRLSKEGAKYGIGLIYATQEITGVDPQILSNSANLIVAFLNSKKETNELSNYYSFEDWADHLRRIEAKGFVRIKTESSPYIIPVQVNKFDGKSSLDEDFME